MRPSDRETLEFASLLENLATHSVSTAGAQACRVLTPRTTARGVGEELARVEDARAITEDEAAPRSAFPDIRPLLARARTEGLLLEAAECLAVADLLDATRRMGSFLRRAAHDRPRLLASAHQLDPLGELAAELERCLDPEGGLRDDASPELRAIRARLRSLRRSIETRLGRLFRREDASRTFADTYVTVRNGRFVVPLRAGASGSVPGIVQDRSTSGETIFVEPLTAVDDNNDLLLATREELAEEARILSLLSAAIGAHAGALEQDVLTLADLDGLFARVSFARRHEAVCPQLSDGEILLREARHPLLALTERDVVPVEIHLEAETKLLVVTGPNTGGKSVALKTLGLASLMAQSGIPVLAAPGARLPLFDSVFTDIGDQQDVAGDLSTFSGHIVNLRAILEGASSGSLILLDEPGTGTDPEDGAALARVLLDELVERGCRILATTHFQSVKVAALSREGARVAAVDFDPETFAPRYRLLYDTIGPSLGLTMARRLGLEPGLLDRADSQRSEGAADLAAAIEELEERRRSFESERDRMIGERTALAAARLEQQKLLDELREKKQRKWSEELGAARRFAEEMRREGRRLLEEARKEPARGARALMDLAREQRRAIAEESGRRAGEAPARRSDAPAPRVGDQVEVAGKGLRGELAAIDGDRARVMRGKIRFDVALDQLSRVGGKPAPQPQHQQGGFRVQRASSRREDDDSPATTELNLIGERVRPALEKLETFLDRQALESHRRARIVHGHGTGALRNAVREFLGSSPHVEYFEEAPPDQGGTGATIAFLR